MLEFSYSMFARSEGDLGFFSDGIAAVNDPFFFDTDPVRRHPSVGFFSVPLASPLPAPASGWLVLAALGALGSLRRPIVRLRLARGRKKGS